MGGATLPKNMKNANETMKQISVHDRLLEILLLIPLRGQETRQNQAGIPHRGRSPIKMPIPLSDRTRRLAEILLQEPERSRISQRLVDEAAEDTPMWHDFSPEGMDKIRFSILRLIAQHPKNENIAFNHARYDWRDLFMAAGFGEEYNKHINFCARAIQNNGERTDALNSHAFGTSGASPAEQASVPKASRSK